MQCVALQQAPQFDITSHPCWKQNDNIAGYISMVILPAHLPSTERVDSVTWALLTLPAHLKFSIKAFKVGRSPPFSKESCTLLLTVPHPRRTWTHQWQTLQLMAMVY